MSLHGFPHKKNLQKDLHLCPQHFSSLAMFSKQKNYAFKARLKLKVHLKLQTNAIQTCIGTPKQSTNIPLNFV